MSYFLGGSFLLFYETQACGFFVTGFGVGGGVLLPGRGGAAAGSGQESTRVPSACSGLEAVRAQATALCLNFQSLKC